MPAYLLLAAIVIDSAVAVAGVRVSRPAALRAVVITIVAALLTVTPVAVEWGARTGGAFRGRGAAATAR